MHDPAYVCGACGMRYPTGGTCAADGHALVETTDPLIGAQIGSYRLVRMLGRGGWGRVYLGVHPTIGGRAAIKVLSEDACGEPDAIQRFLTEARAVNMIRHEGIANVHDFLTLPGGRPAIVMELVEGRTLRDLIDAGPVAIDAAVGIIVDVLSALAAAHAIGVVHRDLKPDNIIIGANGRPKLVDFGIAKLTLNAAGVPRTRTGAVLGTPHYMSPEQIQGDSVDARSDVYSIGVVLFEMLAGRRPFDGASDFEVMVAQVEKPPPALRELRADIPPLVEDVVATSLAKRRGDRFASATAMATALRAAAGDTGALTRRAGMRVAGSIDDRTEHPTVRDRPPIAAAKLTRPQRRWRRIALVGGIAAAAVIGAVGFAIYARGDERESDVEAAVMPGAVASPPAPGDMRPSPSPDKPPPTSSDAGAEMAAHPTGRDQRTRDAGTSERAGGARATVVRAGGGSHASNDGRTTSLDAGVAAADATHSTGSDATEAEAAGPLRLPVDYDVHHLDVIAWLASAQRDAEKRARIVRMYRIKLIGVGRDGYIDMRPPAGTNNDVRSVQIEYRTTQQPCRIRVIAGDDHVGVWRGDGACLGTPSPPAPTCTPRQIWSRGLARLGVDRASDVAADATASIEWDGYSPRWYWTLPDGRGGFDFDDHCGSR